MYSMPLKIYKLRGENCYSLRKIEKSQGRGRPKTLRVYSKCTTEAKAKRQRDIIQTAWTRRWRPSLGSS